MDHTPIYVKNENVIIIDTLKEPFILIVHKIRDHIKNVMNDNDQILFNNSYDRE